MKRFIFDSLVDEENILNQRQVIKQLSEYVDNGVSVVLYGKRNTAKTSIVKNIVIPKWQRKTKGLAIYSDFMHVKDEDDVSDRLTSAFNQAFGRHALVKNFMQKSLDFFRGLKPTFGIDSNGNMEFSIKTGNSDSILPYERIIEIIGDLHKQGTPCLICLDEFQDISLVKTLEAKLRRSFQELPDNLSIVVLGSKHHLLVDIFEKPRAPFYQWGQRLSVSEIDPNEYNQYMRERFKHPLDRTNDEALNYLQDLLFHSPEAIHRICFEANIQLDKPFDKAAIDQLLYRQIEQNSSLFETKLSYYTKAEANFLIHTAKMDSSMVRSPHAQEFLSKVSISSSGMTKIVKKLLNDGIVQKQEGGYSLTDPFLTHYMRKFRSS